MDSLQEHLARISLRAIGKRGFVLAGGHASKKDLRRFLAEMRGASRPDAPDAPEAPDVPRAGLDIAGPGVDLVSVARGFGAGAFRVDSVPELGDAIRAALAAARPTVIEAQVTAPPVG